MLNQILKFLLILKAVYFEKNLILIFLFVFLGSVFGKSIFKLKQVKGLFKKTDSLFKQKKIIKI